MKILIIIPAYNEDKNIGGLIKKLNQVKNIKDIEILVINDHSSDQTSRICLENGITVIDLPCNLGIGGAVQTGYKYAYLNNFDFAVQVDGDGQHNPEYLEKLLLPLINDNIDMVIGSRYIEKEGFQSTLLRRIGIMYFSKLILSLTSKNITDPTSGFRACNSKIIKLFTEYYPTDYPEPESIVFLLRNGFLIKEVPVIMNERYGGISSIRSFRSVYYMIKVSLAICIDLMRRQRQSQ